MEALRESIPRVFGFRPDGWPNSVWVSYAASENWIVPKLPLSSQCAPLMVIFTFGTETQL